MTPERHSASRGSQLSDKTREDLVEAAPGKTPSSESPAPTLPASPEQLARMQAAREALYRERLQASRDAEQAEAQAAEEREQLGRMYAAQQRERQRMTLNAQ